MRIITSKKNCMGVNHYALYKENHNDFDVNAGAVADIVRRDIEDGYGILFKPSIEERNDLLRLFRTIQEFGIEQTNLLLSIGLDSEYYTAMKQFQKDKQNEIDK